MDSAFHPHGRGNDYIPYQPVGAGQAPDPYYQREVVGLWSKQHHPAEVSEVSWEQRRHESKPGWLENNWLWELGSIVAGVGAMVGIIVVLQIFDGKSLDEWNGRLVVGSSDFNISPNVVISVLGTVAKSALMLVIASCISQSKWNWFQHKSRPLKDMQTFDESSRGPWGSVHLLWRTRAMKLVSLGAMATLLALAFDTFLQLVITYPGRNRTSPVQQYTVRRAERFDGGNLAHMPTTTEEGLLNVSDANARSPDGNRYWVTYSSPSSGILASIYNGFLITNDSRRQPELDCPGNCTYGTFLSTAVCSVCNDITDNLQQRNAGLITYVYDLQTDAFSAESLEYSTNTLYPLRLYNPYGMAINDTLGPQRYLGDQSAWYPLYASDLTLQSGSDPLQTVNFQDSQTLLYYVQTIRAEPGFLDNTVAWENAGVTATECGLFMCINEYESQVVNGRLEEKITGSWSIKEPRSWEVFPERQYISPMHDEPTLVNTSGSAIGDLNWNPLYHQWFMNRTDFQLVPPSNSSVALTGSESFNLSQVAIDSTIDLLLNIFNDTTPIRGGFDLGVMADGSVPMEAGLTRSVIHTANSTFYGSDFVRAIYDQSDLPTTFANLAHDMSSAVRNLDDLTAPGVLNNWVTIIHVRWIFMTLPIAVAVLALVLLAGAMWQTHTARTEIWKEGVLPALVYGVDLHARESMKVDVAGGGFEKAGKRRVRLEREADGWTLRERHRGEGSI